MMRLLIDNKHTTGAAVVYVLAKFGALLGAIWMPAHKEQFESTAQVAESAAIAWGLIMAGDAKQSVQVDKPAESTAK